MSIVLLMVIIMRCISSLASTSLTRTSSLSARSLTVMPSASVMVRVIGGGAAGADGIEGADGRSRRLPRSADRGTVLSAGRTLAERRARLVPGRPGMPGRATAAAAAGAPAVTAAAAARPACPACVGRGGVIRGARRCPCARTRSCLNAGASALQALRAWRSQAACAGGGCTMRGCVTCGRLAGASGRAGCGVLPGSSMRRRSVGGTNRPAAWWRRGWCRGDGAVARAALRQRLFDDRRFFDGDGASGPVTTGGCFIDFDGRLGSLDFGNGVAAPRRRPGFRPQVPRARWPAGEAGDRRGRRARPRRARCGLTTLTSRGGPSTGAAGFGGSTPSSAAAAFFAPGLGRHGVLGEHVAAGQRDVALPRHSLDERARHDLFDRARRALQLDAVIALEQRQHFLARRVEQFRDLVNPNRCQIASLVRAG